MEESVPVQLSLPYNLELHFQPQTTLALFGQTISDIFVVCNLETRHLGKSQALKADLQTPIQISILRGHYSSSKTDKKELRLFQMHDKSCI